MEIKHRAPFTRFYSLTSIIILPVLYTTGLLDSIVSYFTQISFLPNTPETKEYILLSLPAPIICIVYMLMLYKLQSQKLFLVTGILIGPILYMMPMEINISYLPLNFVIIPYIGNQCLYICPVIT
jgi:hypothetical protein